MSRKPLEGIRVLDFSNYLPGPLCGQHLADLGADVLKIENPKGGDLSRANPSGEAASRPFLLVNRNKRSLSVNLREPEGVEIILKLAASADVLIDGFRPGVMERLGLGYETLKANNPRLVFCAITGYGQVGPYADKGGHDINYQSLSGVLEQSGDACGPAIGNFQVADLAGGTLTAAMGILAALFDAQRTGLGRYIDVSMTDSALAHLLAPMATVQTYGRGRPMPRGRDFISGRLPCYGTYETADGRHLALGALEPNFWQAFCTAAGRPDLVGRGFPFDEEETAASKAEVTMLVKSRTLGEWTELLADVDACATPVLRLDEVLDHPQTKARGMVVEGESSDGIRYRQFAFPIKMSGYEFSVDRRPPTLGEHNQEVLSALGYTEAQIEALRSKGVI